MSSSQDPSDHTSRIDYQPSIPNIQVNSPTSPTRPAVGRTPPPPAITRARTPDPNPFSYPLLQRPPPRAGRDHATSIRLRRQPSAQALNEQAKASQAADESLVGRRRSTSEPQRPQYLSTGDVPPTNLARTTTAGSQLPNITEGRVAQHQTEENTSEPYLPGAFPDDASRPATRAGRLRAATTNTATRGLQRLASYRPGQPREQQPTEEGQPLDEQQEYEARIVDLLDVVDPEVSTLSTLTNVQNSLFIPDMGRWLNRRPTYDLSPTMTKKRARGKTIDSETIPEKSVATSTSPSYEPSEVVSTATSGPSPPIEPTTPRSPRSPRKPKSPTGAETEEGTEQTRRRKRGMSIDSTLSESRYAVLPHGVELIGWSEEDKEILNDHVRHMLHSRRSAFARSMKGFWKYVQKPLGFFVTLYATLITLFGLAWVLFLIGWIYVGEKQSYLIDVVDYVLVALFAIMGDGLIPWRTVDTYHMIYIAHYHHLSWSRRKKQKLPDLKNHNDLPSEVPTNADIEAGLQEKMELSVLSPEQQRKLDHHAYKYSRSHTFYRPHETETHFAFPVRLLITITVLLDFHSFFQIALGSVTWSYRHNRPQAATAAILSCSICCNVAAGVIISIGDRRTRKKEIIELQFRQSLTRSAIKKVQKQRREEAEALNPQSPSTNGGLSVSVLKSPSTSAKTSAKNLLKPAGRTDSNKNKSTSNTSSTSALPSSTSSSTNTPHIPETRAVIPAKDLKRRDSTSSSILDDDHNIVEAVPDNDPRVKKSPVREKTSLELARERVYGERTPGAFVRSLDEEEKQKEKQKQKQKEKSKWKWKRDDDDNDDDKKQEKQEKKSKQGQRPVDSAEGSGGQDQQAAAADDNSWIGGIKKILPYSGT